MFFKFCHNQGGKDVTTTASPLSSTTMQTDGSQISDSTGQKNICSLCSWPQNFHKGTCAAARMLTCHVIYISNLVHVVKTLRSAVQWTKQYCIETFFDTPMNFQIPCHPESRGVSCNHETGVWQPQREVSQLLAKCHWTRNPSLFP